MDDMKILGSPSVCITCAPFDVCDCLCVCVCGGCIYVCGVCAHVALAPIQNIIYRTFSGTHIYYIRVRSVLMFQKEKNYVHIPFQCDLIEPWLVSNICISSSTSIGAISVYQCICVEQFVVCAQHTINTYVVLL